MQRTSKSKAFLELMRPGNCIIAAAATAIGFFLAAGIGGALQAPIFLVGAMASAFLVCAGGQVINDVFDARIDKKVHPKKPIPSKRATTLEAVVFALGLFIVGVLISSFINLLALEIAAAFSILLILYSALLYKTKYIGNIIVALGTAFTFVFGASAAFGEVPLLVAVLAGSAFFANMAREVTKDLSDLKKDKEFKRTLPMITLKGAKGVVFLYYLCAVLLALWAYVEFNLNFGYLAFVIISAFIFARAAGLVLSNKYEKSHKLSKKGMIASLVAYILAILG